jgi:hypothetical protein
MQIGCAVIEDGACSHVGSVEPDQSVAGIVQAVAGGVGGDEDQQEIQRSANEPSADWARKGENSSCLHHDAVTNLSGC